MTIFTKQIISALPDETHVLRAWGQRMDLAAVVAAAPSFKPVSAGGTKLWLELQTLVAKQPSHVKHWNEARRPSISASRRRRRAT